MHVEWHPPPSKNEQKKISQMTGIAFFPLDLDSPYSACVVLTECASFEKYHFLEK